MTNTSAESEQLSPGRWRSIQGQHQSRDELFLRSLLCRLFQRCLLWLVHDGDLDAVSTTIRYLLLHRHRALGTDRLSGASKMQR